MSETRTIQVDCGDGEMAMHVWVPESGTGPGLVLIQEIFGVGAYIRAVAERLAAAGYVVATPDVFWRFAPGWASPTSTRKRPWPTARLRSPGWQSSPRWRVNPA
jgi:dienelactone hydrolase